MRKVILYIAQSLDGYIADEKGNIDFLNEIEYVEEDNSYDILMKDIDTVILGRKTYDQITQVLAPDQYPYEGKTSYVFTTHKRRDTEEVFFVDSNLVEFVKQLKQKPGKNIWIVGGGQIINQLVKADLIDEYQITTVPVILGDGIRLFDKKPLIKLKTSHSELKNGLIQATWVKK